MVYFEVVRRDTWFKNGNAVLFTSGKDVPSDFKAGYEVVMTFVGRNIKQGKHIDLSQFKPHKSFVSENGFMLSEYMLYCYTTDYDKNQYLFFGDKLESVMPIYNFYIDESLEFAELTFNESAIKLFV